MAEKSTKKQLPGICRFLFRLFQIILYIPIQAIFIPLAIIGIADATYKEIWVSKKLGVSFTAIKALQFRWLMHYFNNRPDPVSVEFIKKLPCESHFGLWSLFGALIISQRLFGFTTKFAKIAEPGKETTFSTPGSRVLLFDRIIEKYVDEMEQIVIPGSGFDLIALRFTKGKEVKVFEIDQVKTLKVKIDTLKKAAIKHDWINGPIVTIHVAVS